MDAEGKTIVNPIFTNLNTGVYTGPLRDPTRVLYAAVVGVPWQLIARQNAAGQPDLIGGVSSVDPTQIGGFKTPTELARLDSQGYSFWDDIAGDPENYVPARSPYMQESTVPRTGVDPITHIPIAAPDAGAGASPINGHERTIKTPPNSIEYACLIPLATPIDEGPTGSPAVGPCGGDPNNDDPACAPNPNDPGHNTLQTSEKAFPGIKHLAIARGLGDQGIVGSVCPAQISDPTTLDYGYRPSIRAILDRVQRAERASCYPRALSPDATGAVACVMVEGTNAASCSCNAPGRSPVTAAHQSIVATAEGEAAATGADLNCFCEIDQTQGADLTACATNPEPMANGWCYVAASEGAAQARLVARCPATEQQQIRFVGAGAPQVGSSVFLACGQ
jgi:hypothetical protein